MSSPSPYRDIVTSHLREDTRILASLLAVRRVFHHSLYQIFICVYSGLMDSPSHQDDLVTCLVIFNKENLRIMSRLWSEEILGDRSLYIETVIERLIQEGSSPIELITNAKKWCKVPFTEEDKNFLNPT